MQGLIYAQAAHNHSNSFLGAHHTLLVSRVRAGAAADWESPDPAKNVLALSAAAAPRAERGPRTPVPKVATELLLKAIDIDYCLSKSRRRLLREIVTDTARDQPVFIFA
jgi:hypothetical protein